MGDGYEETCTRHKYVAGVYKISNVSWRLFILHLIRWFINLSNYCLNAPVQTLINFCVVFFNGLFLFWYVSFKSYYSVQLYLWIKTIIQGVSWCLACNEKQLLVIQIHNNKFKYIIYNYYYSKLYFFDIQVIWGEWTKPGHTAESFPTLCSDHVGFTRTNIRIVYSIGTSIWYVIVL